MRKVLMLATAVTLSIFTLGCTQQKKVIELDPNKKSIDATNTHRGTIIGGNRGSGIGTNQTIIGGNGEGGLNNGVGYSNVDPYGNNANGNNGTGYSNISPYGNNGNGNGNGNFGNSNGTNYAQNSNGNYRQNNSNGKYNQNTNYNGSVNGMDTIYFAVNKYAISGNNIPKIIKNAKIIKKSGRGVIVEGHCDASGTDEYNYALGLKRAKAAKEALINRGVNASDIRIVSMGESAPVCTDFSAGCFAKNRRVEFK